MSEPIIANSGRFNEIIGNLKGSGVGNLHILSDFDRTITKAFYRGEKRPSIISVLRKKGLLEKNYSKEAYALYDKYHPIEIDPAVSMMEKKTQMTKWWQEHLDLLVKSKFKKRDIQKVINSGTIKLRGGVGDFLNELKELDIPLIIISANGLGKDSTSLFLDKKEVLYDNIEVIGNEFMWDHAGNAIGYKKPLIHVFNKDETVLKGFPKTYKKIKKRKNIILLGDSLGDPGMSIGSDYENILKIGFLNEKEEELLEDYKKVYDVIITGDGNFSFVNKLIREIS